MMLILSFLQSIQKAFAADAWGPTNSVRYEEWRKFKEEKRNRAPRTGNWFQRSWKILMGR